MALNQAVGVLFIHEPAGVILKSRFAELSTLDPTFPGQFRKPLPASRCESATSSRRCRSNTAFSSSWLIWRNQWVRVQLVSQCAEFLVNSFSFRFESLDCQLDDSTICHLPSVSQSAAFCALTCAPSPLIRETSTCWAVWIHHSSFPIQSSTGRVRHVRRRGNRR